MENNEENIRVRFSKVGDSRMPKNTLVTKRDGDTIYFGISRCMLSQDTLRKVEGRNWAMDRLKQAMTEKIQSWITDGSFNLDTSGLYGTVGVEDVKKLLRYFENIDVVCKALRSVY